jgi:hypothetical protein
MANPNRPSTYPCLDCGTRYGYVPPDQHIPKRIYGLCSNCRQYHQHAGTLDQYRVARVFNTNHPAPRQTREQLPRLRPAGALKQAQQERIAARVARNDGIAVALVEGVDNTAARIAAYEAFAAEWTRERRAAA